MKPSEILLAAAAVISDQDSWCAGYRGKDAKGMHVDGWDDSAISRCAIGAVERVVGKFFEKSAEAMTAGKFLARLSPVKSMRGGESFDTSIMYRIAIHNNQSTQPQVLDWFYEAAKLAKEAGE